MPNQDWRWLRAKLHYSLPQWRIFEFIKPEDPNAGKMTLKAYGGPADQLPAMHSDLYALEERIRRNCEARIGRLEAAERGERGD